MSKIHYDCLIAEFKAQAQDIADNLASNNEPVVEEALARLRQHNADISAKNAKLKAILDILAIELGCSNFTQLKKIIKDPFQKHQKDGFNQLWFDKYNEAAKYLAQRGGYLLPLEKRYFLCKEDYITALGLDAADENWQKIRFNWVYPADTAAHFELFLRLVSKSK